jgi:hypothetical protein
MALFGRRRASETFAEKELDCGDASANIGHGCFDA